MTKSLLVTVAQAAQLAPVVEQIKLLNGLHVRNMDIARDTIAKACVDRAERGDAMTDAAFGTHVAWLLGLDMIFDRVNELCELLGVEVRS